MNTRDGWRDSNETDDRDDTSGVDGDGALVDWGANEIFLGGYGSPHDRRLR